jgi:M6 family metalloprotease-like protein
MSLFRISWISAILFVLIFAASVLRSAPLSFVPIELVQPDGTRLHVFASGDEFYNWVHDKDNYTIIQDPSSHYYVYAVMGKEKLLPSPYIVGKSDIKSAGLTQAVNVFPTHSQGQTFAKAAYTSMVSKNAQLSGFSNLVIFVRFQSEPEFVDSFSRYDSLLNSSYGPSLKQYYQEVSWNQFIVNSYIYQRSGNLIVSYMDSHPRGYYLKYDAVTNPIGYTTDANEREMSLLDSALTKVRPLIPSSLNLDGNGDGKVDNVTFVISGNPGPYADVLWPHTSEMPSSPAFYLNGKIVSSYSFQFENMFEVRVLCHEMGHSVGMPDLYRYTNNTINPCGAWDIMCNGGNVHMTNYMKYKYGKWISSIPEISTDGTYWLKVSTSPVNNIYKIKSPRSIRECFILEFRKKMGNYESQLPGSGLIVYRINERVSGNVLGPPDEIYVYRPDGTLWINGYTSQAFLSSESGRTSIGDSTNPISFLSDGLPGGLSIKNIGSSGGDSIRFDVKIVPNVPIINDYSASKTTYNWLDISNSGTVIQNWMNGSASRDSSLDDGYTTNAIPLGFDFEYYGKKYSSIYVGINGLVSFTQKALNVDDSEIPSISSFGYFSSNIFWPCNTQFPASIAVAYNDYDLNSKDTYGGGRIMYQTLGNQFVLSWINVGTFEQPGDTTNSFQLVLDGTNSSMTINFQNFGLPATRQAIKVGIQKDSTNGLSWLETGDYADRIPANGSSVIIARSPSGIAEVPDVPRQYSLGQNYPNPFNPTTTITFFVGMHGHMSIRIYDVLGREVATLVDGKKSPGIYEIVWDASHFASGIYFYSLRAGEFSQVRKMVLIK